MRKHSTLAAIVSRTSQAILTTLFLRPDKGLSDLGFLTFGATFDELP
jgi:hypothetical protein